MAYLIEYENTIKKTFFQLGRKRKRIQSIWVVVLVCVIVLGYIAINYKDILLTYLLPGDASVTASAIHSLINDIKAGQGVEEAVTAFCREIIHNAAISQ